MKKIFKFLAVAAAAACAIGIAGCSSSSDTGLNLDSYWYVDTYSRFQNTAVGTEEEIVYNISLTQGSNSSYHVTLDESEEHTYTTRLGIGIYNWEDNSITYITEANRDEYKAESGYGYTVTGKKEMVYYLETELIYSGAFVYGSATTEATSDNSVEFTNILNTVTYFRSAADGLKPVYSYRYVDSTSPNNYSASSAGNMCTHLNYEYKLYYNYSCTSATYKYTDHANTEAENADTESTIGLSSDNSIFDNNQLYIAMRAMNLSSSISETISLVTPDDRNMTDVSIEGNSYAELDMTDEAQSAMANVLINTYGQSDLYEEPSEDDEDADSHSYIYYNAVDISASSGGGVTQTAWYASVEDETDNQYRATLIYLSIPLSFNLGTMEYSIKSINSVIAPDASV